MQVSSPLFISLREKPPLESAVVIVRRIGSTRMIQASHSEKEHAWDWNGTRVITIVVIIRVTYSTAKFQSTSSSPQPIPHQFLWPCPFFLGDQSAVEQSPEQYTRFRHFPHFNMASPLIFVRQRAQCLIDGVFAELNPQLIMTTANKTGEIFNRQASTIEYP